MPQFWHSIGFFTVCQITLLGVSGLQKARRILGYTCIIVFQDMVVTIPFPLPVVIFHTLIYYILDVTKPGAGK